MNPLRQMRATTSRRRNPSSHSQAGGDSLASTCVSRFCHPFDPPDEGSMMIVASWFVILVSSCLSSQEPTEIVLGGPRKVVASIETDPDSFLVRVRMRAVQCFDATTNRRLNQQKASLMASRVLLIHLKGRKSNQTQRIEVSNTETVSSSLKGDLFEQTIRFPREKVVVVAPEEIHKRKAKDRPPHHESPSDIQEGNLFTCKQDHLDTLESLSDSIVEDLRDVRRERASPGKTDHFYSRIADCEEAQVTRLATLRREVKADRLLLNLEQEEIFAQINRRETETLHELSEIVKSWERQVKQSKKEGGQ